MSDGPDDGPDQDRPEEIPPNEILNRNEDQRSFPLRQQLHPNTIHPTLPPQAHVQTSSMLPVGSGNPALLQYYEAQMRDHALQYANAAAAAAMTAAQIAADIASSNGNYPQIQPQIQPSVVPMSPMSFSDSPQFYHPSNLLYPNNGQSYQHQSWAHTPPQPSLGYEHERDQSHHSFNPTEGSNYSQHRRKRQQRVPSSTFHGSSSNFHSDNANMKKNVDFRNHGEYQDFSPNNNIDVTSFGNNSNTTLNRSQQGQQKRRRRRRRFWNDAGSSDSGDPCLNQHSNNIDGNHNRNGRRNRKMAKAASSGSDGGNSSWVTKKKQRQPNDDSLLGKTGVSALYEWCNKRRSTPSFSTTQGNNKSQYKYQEELLETQQDQSKDEGKRRRLELGQGFFETIVSIDGIEFGTGRGWSKTSAKHEASRRALMTLLPGVEFDEESGILIRLPEILPGIHPRGASRGRAQQKRSTTTSLEDLAPNLAKQLAIVHSNDEVNNVDFTQQKERNATDVLARDSRKRQKWPHVYPGTSTTSDDEDENSYYASRGAYVCSSLLQTMIQIDDRLKEPPEFSYEVSAITNEAGRQCSKLKRKAGVPITATSTTFPRGSFQCTGILKLKTISNSHSTGDTQLESNDETRECYRLLRASGVGGTKREARHTAAAKLLAMLFPECDGMADVKQAAEAAREKYAASRALKQQSKRKAQYTSSDRPQNRLAVIHSDDNIARNLTFRKGLANIPTIPSLIKNGLYHALEASRVDQASDWSSGINGVDASIEAGLVRQLSRQQQLEEKVDCALQKLNEHDDEGRSLPDADDVGRTVLRRARVDDMVWIEKNFNISSGSTCRSDLSPSFESALVSEKEPSDISMQMWSSSTIVLLLCRAAAHGDPPLGCAVLTVGFSFQKGKILRIAQIAKQSHQPRERFIETLSVFAKKMGCSLVTSPTKSSFATLGKSDIQRLLDIQFDSRHPFRKDEAPTDIEISPLREESSVKPSLQAVEEEGEGAEDSDSSSPSDEKEKRREKPSKRSRFE